tara:strand:+ start:208 stop:483 length:276 start_codon:yes stop_codon:yes gene_type:complete
MVTNLFGSIAYATGGMGKLIGNKTKSSYNKFVYGNTNKYKITIIEIHSGEILKEDSFSHDEMLNLLESTKLYGPSIRLQISTIGQTRKGVK